MGTITGFLAAPATIRVCQIAIGLILGFAGLAKIGDLQSFAVQIHNFRMVPIPVENLIAMTLPWIEVVAALALILGIESRAAAILAAALMALFTIAVAVAFARGLDIECGCFGTADASRVGAVKLMQNAGMTAIAGVAALRPRRR